MNILLTGGAGFIGSHLAEAYLREGHTVVVLDDLSTGREQNVPAGATLERLDIRDDGLMEVFERHQIDFVNHHAARADVRDAVKRPGLYLDVNIRGGLNLLQCSSRAEVSGFVFASSGGCSYGEPEYVPTDETHRLNPHDPYGASKVAFELYLRTWFNLYGLPYTIFRYPNVYGPRQDPFGESAVIAIFAGRMLRNIELTIFGGGEQVRDFVFVDDIVRANVMATERSADCAYNLGHGVGVSVNDIYEGLARIVGYEQSPVAAPPRLGEIARSVLTSARIGADWGWRPQVSLEDGLRRTVEHIRTHELAASPTDATDPGADA